MSPHESHVGALETYAKVAYAFARDLHEKFDLCAKHNGTTAIHTKGKTLQVFRMFDRDDRTAKHLRDAAASLPSWEETPVWDWEGSAMQKIQSQVDARTRKHPKLLPVISRGVAWGNTPVIIHGYKYEEDPMMKLELLLPSREASQPEFALKTISAALECHEYLIPDCVATPRPPYSRHEAEFETLTQHLVRTLPEDLYDLCQRSPRPQAK